MLNIAEHPPRPGASLAEIARAAAWISAVVSIVIFTLFVVPIPAAFVGMRLSRHISPENAGLLAIGGGFVAGVLTSRNAARFCRRRLT